jgi:hypothetical protein
MDMMYIGFEIHGFDLFHFYDNQTHKLLVLGQCPFEDDTPSDTWYLPIV